MGSKEEMRIFVGGLSWDTTERHLEDAFSRFGKVLEAQIMLERDTGRPRGFGFVTFSDQRGMEAAISEMHGRELDGRVISVNKAEPKIGSDGPGYGYSGGGGRGGYPSGGRGEYGGGGPDRSLPPGKSECFKCGRAGHWARECPSPGGGGGGGKFSSRSRFSGPSGGGGARGDRFGGSDRYNDRYADDRYDGGRYESGGRYEGGRYESGGRYEGGHYGDRDRDRVDSRDGRYGAGRDRYANDRYAPGAAADRYSGDKYGGPDRYPQNGYGRDRGYDRDGSARGGSDRYAGGGGAGGPARYEGGGGYRDRPGPYDRPSRAARPSSYDERY